MKGYKKEGLVKPTLEEIKEYFKDAKVVKCQWDGMNEEYSGKNIDVNSIKSEIWCGQDLCLWKEEGNGYAKILEYKSKPMKKVIRLDEPKEESNSPVRLTHYLNDMGWEEVTDGLNMKDIKEIIAVDIQTIYEDCIFIAKFTDGNRMLYKGYLNDGVY